MWPKKIEEMGCWKQRKCVWISFDKFDWDANSCTENQGNCHIYHWIKLSSPERNLIHHNYWILIGKTWLGKAKVGKKEKLDCGINSSFPMKHIDTDTDLDMEYSICEKNEDMDTARIWKKKKYKYQYILFYY